MYSRYHKITDVYTTALLLTSLHQMTTLGSGMVLGPEASLPLAQSAPAVSHDTRFLSLYGIARSMLMLLEPYLGSFPCICSCLMEEVQD